MLRTSTSSVLAVPVGYGPRSFSAPAPAAAYAGAISALVGVTAFLMWKACAGNRTKVGPRSRMSSYWAIAAPAKRDAARPRLRGHTVACRRTCVQGATPTPGLFTKRR